MALEESIYHNDIKKILELERGIVSGISLSYRSIPWTPQMTCEPYLKSKLIMEKKKHKELLNIFLYFEIFFPRKKD